MTIKLFDLLNEFLGEYSVPGPRAYPRGVWIDAWTKSPKEGGVKTKLYFVQRDPMMAADEYDQADFVEATLVIPR